MALFRRLTFTMLLMSFIGCGGGGGFDGGVSDPGTVAPDLITLTLSISNENVSLQSPATVSVTVLQGSTALVGKLITFTINNSGLGFFDPEIGTALTDSSGTATIKLNVGNIAGAGIITATIDSQEQSTIGFSSLGDGNIVDEGPVVADLSLFASSQQLASSGSQKITLTALAKDSNNNLVEGVTVVFAAGSGQIEVINAVTGPDGKATANLKTDNEAANRIITTTATSGSFSDSVDVEVVGTSVTLTGSASLAINDDNNYIVKVLDSDGNGIASAAVNLSLTGIATLPAGAVANITLVDTITTDFTGQAIVNVTGVTGGTNSIVASALGASASQNVSVQADSFLFTSFNDGNVTIVNPSEQPVPIIPEVLLSDTASLTLTWLRSGTTVPDGTVVNFTTTRGVLAASSATTVNGLVTATVTSSDAGKALVTFTGVDGDVVLNNQLEFEFIAEAVNTIVAQASPKSIGPNGQTSTISIVAKDINGNLVKNKAIKFTLTDNNGGGIFPPSAVTDSNGSASTVYTSNAISAQNGVSIKATVVDDPTKSAVVTLTVADRELFISLGTGNEIEEIDSTSYNKQYSVFVTDTDSNPVENVTLTVSAIPNNYYKGQWVAIFKDGEFDHWEALLVREDLTVTSKFECINEDLNLDGILDLNNGVSEDTNGDGFLTPGNIVAANGEVTTNEQGRAIIDIIYAQSFGHWTDINLIVSTRVSGTESSTKATFTLPVAAADITNENAGPPTSGVGLSSPFGTKEDCSIVD